MTRAQQSISLGLLVLSVRLRYDLHFIIRVTGLQVPFYQLYLACYLQLIPFGSKVQDEIIPVVRAKPAPFSSYLISHTQAMKTLKITG